MNDHTEVAAAVRARIGDAAPRIALVLGSGLGAVADAIAAPIVIPYTELPGFPPSTVEGHAGCLLVGTLYGVSVACMQGRVHYYEGHAPARIAIPIRALRAIGCTTIILTNAAGGLRQELTAGSLMLIADHINWAGVNPLIGPNDDALGPRFPDMSQAYHPALLTAARQAAREAGITLHEGVYLMCSGPSFETPAEIRAFARLGADAVGMSTVPETLVANHCGMKVAALSGITNPAAGLTTIALTHEETLRVGATIANDMARFLERFIPRCAVLA
ncbi:MAG: purine-nucleoside phosphorylase [Gammaproteobacteria bacterium]